MHALARGPLLVVSVCVLCLLVLDGRPQTTRSASVVTLQHALDVARSWESVADLRRAASLAEELDPPDLPALVDLLGQPGSPDFGSARLVVAASGDPLWDSLTPLIISRLRGNCSPAAREELEGWLAMRVFSDIHRRAPALSYLVEQASRGELNDRLMDCWLQVDEASLAEHREELLPCVRQLLRVDADPHTRWRAAMLFARLDPASACLHVRDLLVAAVLNFRPRVHLDRAQECLLSLDEECLLPCVPEIVRTYEKRGSRLDLGLRPLIVALSRKGDALRRRVRQLADRVDGPVGVVLRWELGAE